MKSINIPPGAHLINSNNILATSVFSGPFLFKLPAYAATLRNANANVKKHKKVQLAD